MDLLDDEDMGVRTVSRQTEFNHWWSLYGCDASTFVRGWKSYVRKAWDYQQGRIDGFKAENCSLTHDIERLTATCSELATENGRLRDALKTVAYYGLDNVCEEVRNVAKQALEID